MAGLVWSILFRESFRVLVILALFILPPLFFLSEPVLRQGYLIAMACLAAPGTVLLVFYVPKFLSLYLDQLRMYHNLDVVMQYAQEAIIIVDEAACIVKMNQEASRLTGWSENEAQGRPLLEVYQIKDYHSREPLDNWRDRLQHSSGPGSASILLEGRHGWGARIKERGGTYRLYRGEMGWIILFSDISDELALHDRLHHAQKLESIGMLTGGIAHDFNNMLSGMMGAAELIQTEAEPGSEQEALADIILKTGERAATLTQRLLSFSRKNIGQPADLEFVSVVQEAVGILEHSLDKKIKIRFTPPKGSWYIRGEASQIQSSLLNLGVNARDAMPHGGQLTITVTREHLGESFGRDFRLSGPPGDYLALTVKDNGNGMTGEIQEKLFSPFFTTKPAGEGTGLGLAAVLRCMKEHEGALWMHSEPQKGTEFRLYFPLISARIQEEPQQKTVSLIFSGKILLVDDEPLVLTALGEMASSLGLEPLRAGSGEEALELLDSLGTPAAALVDVVMPRMGGVEVLHRLKKLYPRLPVILMSGQSRPRDREKYLQEGAADFLLKPFLRQKLTQTLESLVPSSASS